jgi:hypothetical protein
MKHIITIETKKEIELTLPHYFKLSHEGIGTDTYYAAVSDHLSISIFSKRDINMFSFGSIVLRHIGEPTYVEITREDFEVVLQETYKNIDTFYLEELKKGYIKNLENLVNQ